MDSYTNLYSTIRQSFNHTQLFFDEPMKNHSSFKIGGPADVLFNVKNTSDCIDMITFCKENNLPFYVIGNGSNLLVTDKGFRGVIIKLGKDFSDARVNEDEVWCQAGILLSTLSSLALKNNLAGLEFASGIPGTVGGAVCMNAGAYGPEIKDILLYAQVLTPQMNVVTLSNEELNFGYRTSRIQKDGMIVLTAVFSLRTGRYEEVKGLMDELNQRRKDKQPLEYPSAGSTFKRPPGFYAGQLIEECGLKGFRIGGAQVSAKHSGFVINNGEATAEDVLTLMEHVRTTVFEKTGVLLEPEVKIIGQR